jgi:hypothetical protein
LIFIIYWFLIFEGALRKWGLPELHRVFFFSRVPLTLILYWGAVRSLCWPRTTWPLLMAYGFAAIALILVAIQITAGGYDHRYLLIAGYGWINYFFYIPLAFLIAEQFGRADLERLTRNTLWVAICAAPVVAWQFSVPAEAVINLGAGLDESEQFRNLGAALGYVRPTGFFTSTLGQQAFMGAALALTLAAWILPERERRVGWPVLIAGTLAVFLMLALSGSRGLFFLAGLVAATTIVAGVLTRRGAVMTRAVLWPALGIAFAIFLWPLLLPTGFEVFITRWLDAWSSESREFSYGPFGRVAYTFYAFAYYLADTPFLGYLLGFGGNAVWRLDWVRLPTAASEWAGYGIWGLESGWAIHLIELGVPVGLLFIFYRVGLTVWLGWRALRAACCAGDPLPLVLFGFVGIILLNQPLTSHGTVNGFGWMFLGFCLAATRTNREDWRRSVTRTRNPGVA